jgi:hypothetical protein
VSQLELPFLTADDVATIDQAREAIDRAHHNAIVARRPVEADELERLGDALVAIIERNAAANRARR